MKSEDNMTKAFLNITKEGNQGRYKFFRELDQMLPQEKQFMDDVVRYDLSKEIDVLQAFRGGIGNGLIETAGPIGRSLLQKQGSVIKEPMVQATRMGLIVTGKQIGRAHV